MDQKKVALVLGGGGAAGHAWMIGVVAGLAEAGPDLTQGADLVIGTSSGATAAAWLRSGIPAGDLYASVLAEPARAAGQAQTQGRNQSQQRPPASSLPASLPMSVVFDRMRAIGASAHSADDLRRKMGEFALETEGTLDPAAAAQRRALVASRLPRQDWPERPMIIVAVNAHTGEPTLFTRASGVDLADAITASTALPGGHTHGVNGVRYINGGVRSADNADLAAGYKNIVVLTPFSERKGPLPPGQFEGIRRTAEWGNDLASQVAGLRRNGSRVEVIAPDDMSREAMGVNQMDPATRIPSARAGFAQGIQEAGRVTFD